MGSCRAQRAHGTPLPPRSGAARGQRRTQSERLVGYVAHAAPEGEPDEQEDDVAAAPPGRNRLWAALRVWAAHARLNSRAQDLPPRTSPGGPASAFLPPAQHPI